MRRFISPLTLAPLLAAGFALAALQPARAQDETPAEPVAEAAAPPQFALLVGVSEYDHLPERDQLAGCAADVELMQSLLAERYGFAAENIVTLTGPAATGEGIRGEMAALVEQVAALPEDSPPAQVVFHFSGHGSQMPDQPLGDPDCDEVDGLDETLVPADATAQGGAEDIRDDELYAFLEQLAGNGRAHVWVVLDCCHSGSGARGTTKFRRLNRGLTFLPPAEQADRIVQEKRLPPGVVVLSACAASEVEPEYVEGEDHYGLLTRFLTSTLTERQTLSDLTYANLHAGLRQRYTIEAALLQPPSPQLEGDAEAMAGIILSAGESSDRPEWLQARFQDGDAPSILLPVGSLHDVLPGDVYECGLVAIHADGTGQTIPMHTPAEVFSVDATSARAKLLDLTDAVHNRLAAGDDISSDEGRIYLAARLVSRVPREYEHQFRIQVHLQPNAEAASEILAPGSDAPLGIYLGLLDAMNEGRVEPAIWVGPDEPCDYILRIVGETGALFPATGFLYPPAPAEDESGQTALEGDIPAALVGGWGPLDLSTEAGGEMLGEYLQRIAQARNVLRMAAEQQEHMAENALAVDLELVAIEWDGEAVTAATPWPADAEGQMTMYEGDTYALRVTNNSRLNDPIYVTILRIDPNLGVDVALPYQLAQGVVPEQILAPGESRTCSPYRCGNDYGLRWALVLASRDPQSFTSLAQRGLPVIRGQREEIPAENSWTAATIRWVVQPPATP